MTETTLTFAVQRPAVAEHSRFVQRIRRRYDKELPLLPPGAPTLDVMRTTWPPCVRKAWRWALRCACCAIWSWSGWLCSTPSAGPAGTPSPAP